MQIAQPTRPVPIVSLRWLLTAVGLVILAAVACSWLTLCLLFWQGSWQLLYHPRPTLNRNPAKIGLNYEVIRFASTETGTNQLVGWWLPAPDGTPDPVRAVLYLHGAEGNLSDTLPTLYTLHHQNLAIFAFDYRGYGQSQANQNAGHPSERQLRQDAEWALTWLTLTHNIPAKQIIVYGSGLGATLAAELAADHSELAGVILDEPQQHPLDSVFKSPRSRFVPARWLVSDRYNLTAAATRLQVPSLWLFSQADKDQLNADSEAYNGAFQAAPGKKSSVWLKAPVIMDHNYATAMQRWLGDL